MEGETPLAYLVSAPLRGQRFSELLLYLEPRHTGEREVVHDRWAAKARFVPVERDRVVAGSDRRAKIGCVESGTLEGGDLITRDGVIAVEQRRRRDAEVGPRHERQPPMVERRIGTGRARKVRDREIRRFLLGQVGERDVIEIGDAGVEDKKRSSCLISPARP